MGDTEGLARNAVQEITFDGFGRGVGDGMNQSIEAVPVLGQFDEQVVDLLVAGDVDGNGDVAAEFSGELLDAVFETLGLVGEGELSPSRWQALAMP